MSIRSRYLRGVCAGLALLGATGVALADCSRSFVVNQADWLPYMYRDADGRRAGLDYELVKGVLDHAGCDYEFVDYPSKRALVKLQEGTIDLLAGASVTPEREAYSRFTVPYRQERIVLLVRREDRDRLPTQELGTLIEDFNLVLGAIAGGYYGQAFDGLDRDVLMERDRLVMLNSNRQLLNLLTIGRIDAVVGDGVSLHVSAASLDLVDQVSVHGRFLNQDPVHLMLSKRTTSEQDLEMINQAIREYTVSEDYQALINRYQFEMVVEATPSEEIEDSYRVLGQ
ncbi:substrate-binding periplasmic protein [Marinobacter xestospongiae]|uniref:substrate-binding periplasmic protein n=1 Tax=Marinobacter xestospongiae TaxID=994319 RepID=UPI002002C75A|nr:transporter substrate-binding domain-containing protein [Marinobacter xestospongiae]MCK7565888.1 transporter substrate-binding domain-containing protein [Marinobacter xestospongiae]